jgi:hypothetical protein
MFAVQSTGTSDMFGYSCLEPASLACTFSWWSSCDLKTEIAVSLMYLFALINDHFLPVLDSNINIYA